MISARHLDALDRQTRQAMLSLIAEIRGSVAVVDAA
jgi:hypothetical protein